MQSPLVTVITPTYNRADYLVETIESVLNQNYPNLEYIVLDDGSKDNTRKILEGYKERFLWDSHPNMGEVRTVNKGFEMARGDIIGIVNSDDPLLPGAVSCIVEFMQNRPDVGVVYPDWDYIDAGGKRLEHVQTFEYSFINMLRWHHCMPGPAAFFRKKIVALLGGRDTQFRYVSDFDFWLRAGFITDFARIPKTLASFRVHPDSASASQTNEKMAEEHIRLVNKIFAFPNLTTDVLRIKKEAYSSAYYIAGCVCQSCNMAARRAYFYKALSYSPYKYLSEYRGRLLGEILPIIFPPFYYFKMAWSLLKDPKRVINAFKKRLHA